MSGFDQIDEACIAGQRAENSDFATPTGTAGINPLKIAKRNIYIPFPVNESVRNSNLVAAPTGVFPGMTFQNASAGYGIFQGMTPRGEVSSGEKGTLKILWSTSATTGNLRLVAQIAILINGISSLAAAVSRNVIQAANTSGNALSIASLAFPPAVFNANQLWHLKLDRDPANVLDTLAADIIVHAIWMEILGRC